MEENLDIVYLFGYSGNTGTHLDRLLPILILQKSKNSRLGVVLIHDGVIGITTKGKIPTHIENLLDLDIKVFAMIPDLKARGIDLDYISENVKPIEYDGLVDLLDTTQKIISWM